ncbi:MAG TPA: GatB/YqeY domain-containing protein [Xanthobacteraceae bacterium]|nr:GatB/YqeY domain-containing protein [Xanthobacteraceae bacterium]
MLREQINESIKSAMKSKDKQRLSTLRLVSSAIKYAEIEAERTGRTLSEDDILSLLQKMIKQRQESVDIFDKAGRKELADQERGEIEVIKGFLPQQMSEAEAGEAIGAVIKEIGAQGVKDMGKVMAALKQAYAGKMDFGKASGLVKTLLTPQA